jgi:hypothetical protein
MAWLRRRDYTATENAEKTINAEIAKIAEKMVSSPRSLRSLR